MKHLSTLPLSLPRLAPALFLLLALFALPSWALELRPYSSEAFAAAQVSGKPVALHFHADWCPVCRLQQQGIGELRADPALDLVIFVARYDDEKALRKKHKVVTQSTLIVFRGTAETARIAGETDKAKIRAALVSALQ